MEIIFQDRIDAGKKLAKLLEKYKGREAVILALPRGGVVTAKIVADYLNLPLGLIVSRKIGHPISPEYAIASVSESGYLVKNEEEIKAIDPEWFNDEVNRQQSEAKRRRMKYWGTRKSIDLKDKTAIIIDDGLATGLTMMAAIKEVKSQKLKNIVVAVPVSPEDTADKIKAVVNEFVAVTVPDFFQGAIGLYYKDFPQVTDEEVINILQDPLKFILFDTGIIFHNLAEDIHQALPVILHSGYDFVHFSNREIQIVLHNNVSSAQVMFIGSISPPADQIIESFLVCHTLKKEKANKVIAIFPYLAYMRQDKDESKKSLTADFVAKTAKSSGIDEIITIDIHSEQSKDYFEIPVTSLSPAKLLAQKLREIGFNADTIVAPDEGAIHRARDLRRELNISNDITYFKKSRAGERVESVLSGSKPGPKVVIVDDILDTGKTLINSAKQLTKLGVKEIIIAVTHGLFTGSIWEELFGYNVKKIITTDSVPQAKEKVSEKINIVSIAPIIIGCLKEKI